MEESRPHIRTLQAYGAYAHQHRKLCLQALRLLAQDTYLEAYDEDSLRISWVFMQLGLVYESLKKDQEAKETLEKVLVFHQKHFKVAYLSFYLGNAYKGLGLCEKAQNLLSKA